MVARVVDSSDGGLGVEMPAELADAMPGRDIEFAEVDIEQITGAGDVGRKAAITAHCHRAGIRDVPRHDLRATGLFGQGVESFLPAARENQTCPVPGKKPRGGRSDAGAGTGHDGNGILKFGHVW